MFQSFMLYCTLLVYLFPLVFSYFSVHSIYSVFSVEQDKETENQSTEQRKSSNNDEQTIIGNVMKTESIENDRYKDDGVVGVESEVENGKNELLEVEEDVRKRNGKAFFKVEWWKYLILAFVDVEGNYLLVKAYEYTTIESVQLLDCFTVPCVMLLSFFFLKQKFTSSHFTGVLGCLIGLSLLIFSDMKSNRYGDEQVSNKFLGDLLTICGATLYAFSNVSQEYLVKNYDRNEFLGGIGLFGVIISGIQVGILESNALSPFSDLTNLGYLFGYVICLFIFYSLVPILLEQSSATYLNLSLLTSDFFSVLFAIYLFGVVLLPLYFVAFSVIIVSLIVYNLADIGLQLPVIWNALIALFSPQSIVQTTESCNTSKSNQIIYHHVQSVNNSI